MLKASLSRSNALWVLELGDLGLPRSKEVRGAREHTEVLDKPAIEVSESKEWIFVDGLPLPLVHKNTILTDDVAEELNRRTVEFALLQFQVEMGLSEFLEDLLLIVAMFGQVLGVYEDIIDINDHEAVEELSVHLIHKALEEALVS